MNKYKLVGNEKLNQMKNKYGSEDYKNANKHLKDTLVMAVNDDLKGILPYIDTKVELVWGEKDLEVPLQVGLDSNDIIPNSELTIIPGGSDKYGGSGGSYRHTLVKNVCFYRTQVSWSNRSIIFTRFIISTRFTQLNNIN